MVFTSAIHSPFGVHGAFPLWAPHNPACFAAQTNRLCKDFCPFGATSLFFKALKAHCPFGDNECQSLLRCAKQPCLVKLKVKSLLVALRKTSQDFKSLKAKGQTLTSLVFKSF